jgi:iron-sulfur cluster repair protein YtfE (RIC family)
MDPTKLLEADHRQVEELFSQIESAEGEARMPFIQELAESLKRHMQLEEEVVYPAMEPVVGAEAVQEGNKEHELARKTLNDVLDLAPDEPGFGGALEALKAGIEHHVEEEEGEVFPQLRNEASDLLRELATPFMQQRVALGLPFDASSLAASSSKEELLEEARNAGIEGISSMTKEELAEALVSSMG